MLKLAITHTIMPKCLFCRVSDDDDDDDDDGEELVCVRSASI